MCLSPTGVPIEEQSQDAQLKARLPKTGYFSLADTKAEVYSRAGSTFDPLKRGDRWKSDFIWNEKWQVSVGVWLEFIETIELQTRMGDSWKSNFIGHELFYTM